MPQDNIKEPRLTISVLNTNFDSSSEIKVEFTLYV